MAETDRRTRRGDLAVIERVRIDHARTGRTETTEFAIVLVSNITRDGRVKAVKDVRWGDDAYTQPIDRMLGFRRAGSFRGTVRKGESAVYNLRRRSRARGAAAA